MLQWRHKHSQTSKLSILSKTQAKIENSIKNRQFHVGFVIKKEIHS